MAISAAARCEADVQRFGNAKCVAGANEVAADVIPAAQLLDGYTEAIGDGDESVSAADTIERPC